MDPQQNQSTIPPPPGGGQVVPNPHYQANAPQPAQHAGSIPPPPSGTAVPNPHYAPPANTSRMNIPPGPMSADIEDRRNEGLLGKVRDVATGLYSQARYDYAQGAARRDNPVVDTSFYRPGQDAASQQ